VAVAEVVVLRMLRWHYCGSDTATAAVWVLRMLRNAGKTSDIFD